jgi:hypothetical protein
MDYLPKGVRAPPHISHSNKLQNSRKYVTWRPKPKKSNIENIVNSSA